MSRTGDAVPVLTAAGCWAFSLRDRSSGTGWGLKGHAEASRARRPDYALKTDRPGATAATAATPTTRGEVGFFRSVGGAQQRAGGWPCGTEMRSHTRPVLIRASPPRSSLRWRICPTGHHRCQPVVRQLPVLDVADGMCAHRLRPHCSVWKPPSSNTGINGR